MFDLIGAEQFNSEEYARDVVYIVPGLITEGLVVLSAKPKAGKSFLALNLAVAIAEGGKALGGIQVEQGTVLYMALEDGPQRIRRRANTMMLGKPFPEKLWVTREPTKDPLRNIAEFIEVFPDTRLIVIDVAKKLFPNKSRGNKDEYDAVYDDLGPFQQFAIDNHIAIIAVMHNRKSGSDADSPQDAVHGTVANTGVADEIITLDRKGHSVDAELSITGRDIESVDRKITWDRDTLSWVMAPNDAIQASMTPERRQVYELLLENPNMHRTMLAERCNVSQGTMDKRLADMKRDGYIVSGVSKGCYVVARSSELEFAA